MKFRPDLRFYQLQPPYPADQIRCGLAFPARRPGDLASPWRVRARNFRTFFDASVPLLQAFAQVRGAKWSVARFASRGPLLTVMLLPLTIRVAQPITNPPIGRSVT